MSALVREWGTNVRMWVREEVRASINHSDAPVRVASGTNWKHISAENILGANQGRGAGSLWVLAIQQLLPPPPLTPEETGHSTCVQQTPHLSNTPSYCFIIVHVLTRIRVNVIIFLSWEVTFEWWIWEAALMSMWHAVYLCVIAILDRIDVWAHTLIKAGALSTL